MSDTLVIPYVLGLLFNQERDTVLLIRKAKPAWQAGLLNGIGGKIEPDEFATDALVREFREETGVDTSGLPWREFCRMESPLWVVDCFTVDDSEALAQAATQEVEAVVKIKLSELASESCISNLPWLIALALDQNYGKQRPHVIARYA